MDKLGSVIAIAFFTFSAMIFLFFLYCLVDNTALPKYIVDGQVKEISFKAQHEELVMHGKTSNLDTIPDKWYLQITTIYGSDWIATKHAPWSWQEKGKTVSVIFTLNRFSRDFSIVSISEK